MSWRGRSQASGEGFALGDSIERTAIATCSRPPGRTSALRVVTSSRREASG